MFTTSTEKSMFLIAAFSLAVLIFVSPLIMFFLGGSVAWPVAGTSVLSSVASSAHYLQLSN